MILQPIPLRQIETALSESLVSKESHENHGMWSRKIIPQSLILARCRIGRAERSLPNLSVKPSTSGGFGRPRLRGQYQSVMGYREIDKIDKKRSCLFDNFPNQEYIHCITMRYEQSLKKNRRQNNGNIKYIYQFRH